MRYLKVTPVPPGSPPDPNSSVFIVTLKRRPLWAIALRTPLVFYKNYRIMRRHSANTRFAAAYGAYCLTKILFKNRNLKDG